MIPSMCISFWDFTTLSSILSIFVICLQRLFWGLLSPASCSSQSLISFMFFQLWYLVLRKVQIHCKVCVCVCVCMEGGADRLWWQDILPQSVVCPINLIWWWGSSNAGALRNMEYSFITMASSLAWSGSTWQGPI